MTPSDTPIRLLGEVVLTQANLKSSHIYITPFKHLLPKDLIGGPNDRDLAPRMALVHWGAETPVETDIPSDKNMFRRRGWVKEFFARTGARAGDTVRVEEVRPYSYKVSLVKGAA
jgi:DNA polymerase III subunit epsilon